MSDAEILLPRKDSESKLTRLQVSDEHVINFTLPQKHEDDRKYVKWLSYKNLTHPSHGSLALEGTDQDAAWPWVTQWSWTPGWRSAHTVVRETLSMGAEWLRTTVLNPLKAPEAAVPQLRAPCPESGTVFDTVTIPRMAKRCKTLPCSLSHWIWTHLLKMLLLWILPPSCLSMASVPSAFVA